MTKFAIQFSTKLFWTGEDEYFNVVNDVQTARVERARTFDSFVEAEQTAMAVSLEDYDAGFQVVEVAA